VIESMKTSITKTGIIKVELKLNCDDRKVLQEKLNQIVEFINELDEPFKMDSVDFYNENQAVLDLKNILNIKE
jgi:hypothetical protein